MSRVVAACGAGPVSSTVSRPSTIAKIMEAVDSKAEAASFLDNVRHVYGLNCVVAVRASEWVRS